MWTSLSSLCWSSTDADMKWRGGLSNLWDPLPGLPWGFCIWDWEEEPHWLDSHYLWQSHTTGCSSRCILSAPKTHFPIHWGCKPIHGLTHICTLTSCRNGFLSLALTSFTLSKTSKHFNRRQYFFLWQHYFPKEPVFEITKMSNHRLIELETLWSTSNPILPPLQGKLRPRGSSTSSRGSPPSCLACEKTWPPDWESLLPQEVVPGV